MEIDRNYACCRGRVSWIELRPKQIVSYHEIMYKDGTDMEQNEVAIFQRSIVECGDPVEIARKVKLALARRLLKCAWRYER